MELNDYEGYQKKEPFRELIRNFFATKPKEVDGVLNRSTLYYREQLLRKVLGVYDFTGIPVHWDKDYMLTHLFIDGYFTILDDAKLGVIPIKCGLYGQNVWLHPTEVVIANPVIGNYQRVININCALIKLQYNYRGIGRLLDRYSVLLAMADSSLAVNLMNSKVAFIGLAESKAEAETMYNMYDQLSTGKPAVVVRKQMVDKNSFYFNHVKNNFVGDEIQAVQRRLVNQFLTDVGINNADVDKRERLITDEVMANNAEVNAAAEHWVTNVNDSLKIANTLYGMNIKFERKEFNDASRNDIKRPDAVEQ